MHNPVIAFNSPCPPTKLVSFSDEPQIVGDIADQFIPS